MLDIVQIAVLSDNYIYLAHDTATGATAAIDPAEAEPVLAALAARSWSLTHILNTHHHGDHIGGNLALKAATGCEIVGYGPDAARIPGIDRRVSQGDPVAIGDATAQVLAVPGHTRGHIAFWFRDDNALFCGDTLFALGCGRLFEGTAEQMWASLSAIRALPAVTRIFCAHEYTLANARFALTVEPGNQNLLDRMKRVSELRAANQPTVPSTLAEECATNPFLRPESAEIQAAVGETGAAPEQVFAAVRKRKDAFR